MGCELFSTKSRARMPLAQYAVALPVDRAVPNGSSAQRLTPQMAVKSVRERSTLCSRLQFSHAAGPKKLKSAGKSNCSMPDPRKHPSGTQGMQFQGSGSFFSKLICRSARHFSKARGETCAFGASWFAVSSAAPIWDKEQHSSKALRPNCLHPGTRSS